MTESMRRTPSMRQRRTIFVAPNTCVKRRRPMRDVSGHDVAAVRSEAAGDVHGLRIAILSTFPPTNCGLATFARDLSSSIVGPGCMEVGVIAVARRVDDGPSTPICAPAVDDAEDCRVFVLAQIDRDDRGSYREAADVANRFADVVIIQHEFGIYGGADGEHLVEFVDALEIPRIVTLHTVLPTFSPHQLDVLRRVCAQPALVTVFTSGAATMLREQEVCDPCQVRCVRHGAPEELYQADRAQARASLGVDGKFVLSSFGLLSAGKGLELAIEALPEVIADGIDATLLIAGRTHPEVVREQGETYRESLQTLARDLGVADRVAFLDGFMPIEDIASLLAATDVFVTPYLNADQIVSGALTFALASGCPVVSTPYRYAVDQLSGGAGIIVASRDPHEFARALVELASDGERYQQASRAAAALGETMRWSQVGAEMVALAQALPAKSTAVPIPLRIVPRPDPVRTPSPPALPVDHLLTLADEVAIIQHARGRRPLLSTGYCVDDAGRLLAVAAQLADTDAAWARCASVCLRYLEEAHEPHSAAMRNFMSFDRRWLQDAHHGDHVGRALLGLARSVNVGCLRLRSEEIAADLLENWSAGKAFLHNDAYCAVALTDLAPWAPQSLAPLLLERFIDATRRCERPGWLWPDERIRYDHALLPHAICALADLCDDEDAFELGAEMLDWYSTAITRPGYLRFPGNRGWTSPAPLERSGDEQPIDASAFVRAHSFMYLRTGDRDHAMKMTLGRAWFHGANRLGLPVADVADGACCDGLTSTDTNKNCGAESTIAFADAELTFARTLHLTDGSPSVRAHDNSSTTHPEVIARC